jgi:hypothetical protein
MLNVLVSFDLQVYRGVLRSNGADVAIKVQRPGIEPVIYRDLYIFRFFAGFVNSWAIKRLGTNAQVMKKPNYFSSSVIVAVIASIKISITTNYSSTACLETYLGSMLPNTVGTSGCGIGKMCA